jgi:hypothetical protein
VTLNGRYTKPTDDFLVIRLTVETGTIIVVAAILDLVFFLKEHKTEVHQVSAVILCKLYSNTLLVLFNNRLADGNRTDMVSIEATMAFRVARSTERSTFGDTTSFPLETVKSDREYMHSMEHSQ